MRYVPIACLVICLQACERETAKKNPLMGSGEWQLTEIAGQPIAPYPKELGDHREPYIKIEQSGGGPIRITGFSSCNGFGLLMDATKPDLPTIVEATEMHCGDEIAAQEERIFDILNNSPRFAFDYSLRRVYVTGSNGLSMTGILIN